MNIYSRSKEEDLQLREGVVATARFEKDYFKLEDSEACEEFEFRGTAGNW